MGRTLRTRDTDPATSAEAVAGTDLEHGQTELLSIYWLASAAGKPHMAQYEAITFGRLLGSVYSDSRLRSAHAELERMGMMRRTLSTIPGPTRKRRAELWALALSVSPAALAA